MSQLDHNNIANVVSRLWKKRVLNSIVKNAKNAGFDVVDSPCGAIIVGKISTNEIFLKAIPGSSAWLVRYDTTVFQDSK